MMGMHQLEVRRMRRQKSGIGRCLMSPRRTGTTSAGSRCRNLPCRLIAAIGLLLAWQVFGAGDLPRDPDKPRESYPGIDVLYDVVVAPNRQKLRAIITKPHEAQGKLPVIFVAGWLSCDSVEAPEGTTDATGLVFRGLAQLPGYCLFRIDKPGVGDSEGECDKTDFETELAGYRAAFKALAKYDFIDKDRVYIFGISNGAGFAPLIPETDAEQEQVRGYLVIGGWVKTWFEHMLEIERRHFALMGKTPAQINDRMKGVATFYHEWLFKSRPVSDILEMQPKLVDLWPEGGDHEHLYGRPLAYYQQLQQLNLAAAWSRVKVPTLVLHGQYDWIMSRDDHEMIAKIVNGNAAGGARFMELPATGHTFQHYLSMPDAFAGQQAPFDPAVLRIVTDWFKERREKSSTGAKKGA
jgi:pimeloyl-ACP methyl ester carboxylesterase